MSHDVWAPPAVMQGAPRGRAGCPLFFAQFDRSGPLLVRGLCSPWAFARSEPSFAGGLRLLGPFARSEPSHARGLYSLGAIIYSGPSLARISRHYGQVAGCRSVQAAPPPISARGVGGLRPGVAMFACARLAHRGITRNCDLECVHSGTMSHNVCGCRLNPGSNPSSPS
jgi:hypothetical protein